MYEFEANHQEGRRMSPLYTISRHYSRREVPCEAVAYYTVRDNLQDILVEVWDEDINKFITKLSKQQLTKFLNSLVECDNFGGIFV